MTLPTSGPLTFSDIQTEFGGSNPIGLDEYYAGGANVPAGTSGTYGAVPTSGQISVQNFYGTSDFVPVYIEDAFSTYLYAGNDSTQTITNNIDISTKGALVWVKGRSGTYGTFDHTLINTPISNTTAYSSNTTGDGFGLGGSAFSPTTTGFNLNTASASLNNNGTNYVSWTFAQQPKFFDIVTYTGTGTNTAVPHNLGSAPGCVIVRATAVTGEWGVWHRGTGNANESILGISLNRTNAAASTSGSQSYATSTTFDYQAVYDYTGSTPLNVLGRQYVAYLFAHDAGGFGLTGTDNVISCGSFTTSGTGNATINLGYEPQWLMVKCAGTAGGDDDGNWRIVDSMRGFPTAVAGATYAASATLYPNTSGAEQVQGFFACNSTGFSAGQLQNSKQYIYIAIRRGPMKVPTVGTTVFSPIAATNSAGTNNTTNFPVDLQINTLRSAASKLVVDRLRGVSSTATNVGSYLVTNNDNAEAGSGSGAITRYWSNTGFQTSDEYASLSTIYWNFRRAPSFFDEVCYTGNSVQGRTITHNLGATPELMIVKPRSNGGAWQVYNATDTATKYMLLNSNQGSNTASFDWNNTAPTSSVFTVQGTGGSGLEVNWTGYTYVAYLFATCAGVSKVGSYTGTGALLTVNCGFTSGARFVLIKRSDSTGDWYVYDSARGITSGNDPYLFLNSSAAEVTGTNYVDTTSVGFQVTAAAPAGLNASGGLYIFLAIA